MTKKQSKPCNIMIALNFIDCSFSVSVKRCFESLRSSFNESKEGKEDYVEEQSKRRKYRSRRQRVSLDNNN